MPPFGRGHYCASVGLAATKVRRGSSLHSAMMMLSLAVLLSLGSVGVDGPVPGVRAWLAEVSADRLIGDVRALEGFGTRHLLSSGQTPGRGIDAAADWIKRSLDTTPRTSPPLETRIESFDVPPGVRVPGGARVRNVVAVMPGTMKEAASRAYYVVGHYDSRNADVMDASGPAPGANDDASGTALVMELARIVALRPLESTVVFLCTSGEEQGLLGAAAHAQNIASTSPYVVMGVLNNDIVGDPSPAARAIDPNSWPQGAPPSDDAVRAAQGPDPRRVVRVFSEGLPRRPGAADLATIRSLSAENDSPSRQLARFIAFVTAREGLAVEPTLVFRQDRFLRGGDHAAFNDAGFPAVRFTTLHEEYSRQHVGVERREDGEHGDVSRFVDAGYLADVARVNLAALVHAANAPRPPLNARIITASLDSTTQLAWTAPPEPDVAGYEVVWRATTDWQWRHSLDVGAATSVRLPLNKDNVFIGVRAYDRDGYRSPVAFAAAAKE